MDPQHPRIEPDITARPAAAPETPGLIAPKAALPPKKMTKKRSSLFMRLIKLLLILIALILLPVVLLKWVPPPTTAFMLQSPTKPVQYSWVPAKRIADVARRAVVAAEDQKFRTHNGFDVEAMEKAYAHNKKSKRKRGASTISQQTAKNLFLWSGGGYFRKGIEAGITLLIENIWGKDRILEMYLNIAEFGPGVYGVEAASQAYFHKSAAQLTPNEAARLAAVLPSPRRWKVTAPGTYVQKRVSWIMGQMGYGHGPSEEPEPPSMGPESGGQLNDADDSSLMDSAPSTSMPIETMPSEPVPAEEPVPVAPAPEPENAPAQAPATTP